ncbi:MAG: hypothetical protein NAOJABEB_02987 [Steroidobacteraceae bacterium]|nr:hypothetical protein [Steroidobacteraceae bacterium]
MPEQCALGVGIARADHETRLERERGGERLPPRDAACARRRAQGDDTLHSPHEIDHHDQARRLVPATHGIERERGQMNGEPQFGGRCAAAGRTADDGRWTTGNGTSIVVHARALRLPAIPCRLFARRRVCRLDDTCRLSAHTPPRSAPGCRPGS